MKFAYIKELYRFVPDEFFEGASLNLDEVLDQSARIVYTNEDEDEFDSNELNSLLQKAINDSSVTKPVTDFKLSAELHQYLSECGMNRNIAATKDVWEFYTVFYCMDYVRWRWEKNDKVAKNRVIRPEKGIRNSLSRLWWWAEMTINTDESDPYHLTKNSSVTQDAIQFAMDTIMPTNKKILTFILKYIINRGYGSREVQNLFSKARALNASRKIEFIDEDELERTFDVLMSFGS